MDFPPAPALIPAAGGPRAPATSRAVSLKRPVAVARVRAQCAERRPAGKDLRRVGLLVVAAGLLLLSLAAGDALAGAEFGGRGDELYPDVARLGVAANLG